MTAWLLYTYTHTHLQNDSLAPVKDGQLPQILKSQRPSELPYKISISERPSEFTIYNSMDRDFENVYLLEADELHPASDLIPSF